MPLYWAFYQKEYNLSALCKVVTNIVRALQYLLEIADNQLCIVLFVVPAAGQVFPAFHPFNIIAHIQFPHLGAVIVGEDKTALKRLQRGP